MRYEVDDSGLMPLRRYPFEFTVEEKQQIYADVNRKWSDFLLHIRAVYGTFHEGAD